MKAFKGCQVEHKYHVTLDEAKFSYNNHVYNENGDSSGEDYEDYGEDAYDFTELAALKVKESGKYLVTISGFFKASGQYVYLYQNRDCNAQLYQNSCICMPNTTNFHCLSIAYTTAIDGAITFQLYDVYDYPVELKHLVITAERVGN